VLEETYEVLEAMDAGDPTEHCEELGDLLLQIVFQAQLMKEEGRFEFADVAEAISNKLVSRHPHVFGNADAKDAEAVLRQWAALKREENRAKGGGASVLEGVPREMPALARADRLTEKASRIGFDWPDAAGARGKVTEEIAELDEAIARGDRDAVEHELGDVLFALVNLSRKLGVPPEEALRGSVARFVSRFSHVERELARRGVPHGEATLAEMDALWNEAKALERQAKTAPSPRPHAAPPDLGKDRG
jgi:MazG family protein